MPIVNDRFQSLLLADIDIASFVILFYELKFSELFGQRRPLAQPEIMIWSILILVGSGETFMSLVVCFFTRGRIEQVFVSNIHIYNYIMTNDKKR